ncbi:MAG: UxaA family hydrolase [Candidatus Dormibacteria bacterium]
MGSTTFLGYRRGARGCGVRNHLLVLPTSELLNRASERLEYEVPAAVCITHFNSPAGVRDAEVAILAGFATNPNVGAVLLLGLGDEADPGPRLAAAIRARGVDAELMTVTGAAGMPALITGAVRFAREQVAALGLEPRQAIPVSELIVGTECGGSDSLSGLTANPALGRAMDLLVNEGGSALLCEIPELIGAERLVADRAASPEVAQRVLDAVRAWEEMVIGFGEDLRGAQPSPGNQAGGLTTIEEKSLGTIFKGGSTPVVEVVGYGCAPTRRGLVLMDTPGHDVEQLTGMAAGGAQIVVFTTGRGTPTSSPIAPTIKVSTNSAIASQMAAHIDLDAGAIARGEESIDHVGARIFDLLLEVASGRTTAAEGWGQKDFALPRLAPSTRAVG